MQKHLITLTVVTLTLVFAVTSLTMAAPKIKDPLRFAIIGDRTGGHTPGVYPEILWEIEQLKPDFVMTVGDMIEGYTEDEAQLKTEWEEYMGLWQNLTMPIHHVPGNHDITNEVMLPFYKQNLGDPVYSFTEKGVHFVILDNSRYNTANDWPQEQLDWLEKDLAKHTKKSVYTIAFFHQPHWYNTLAVGETDPLHEIFKKYGVDAVFTGHYHVYFSGEYDGIKYTSLGSSGGAMSPGITGIGYHYAWVTVDMNGIHVAPIHKDSVFPWDEVTAEDGHVVENIRMTAVQVSGKLMADKDLSVALSDFSVTVTNPSESLTLNDTLIWETPRGWTIAPRDVPLMLEPGGMTTFDFKARCGLLYSPVPTFKLDFPYRDGRTFELENGITVMRQVACKSAGEAPIIDGMVTDAAWQMAETNFFGPDGGENVVDATRFFFAHDAENIYLAAVCADTDMGAITANVQEHDGPIYTEDCVGYFFVPSVDGGVNFQVYFNPNGMAFDQKIMFEGTTLTAVEREWNGEYKTAVEKAGDHWSIEARIPLSTLGVTAEAGDEWKVNFRRKQSRLGSSADWMTPISYDPQTYGILKFK